MSEPMESGWVAQLTGNQDAAREAVKARGWTEEDAEEYGYEKDALYHRIDNSDGSVSQYGLAVFTIPASDAALTDLAEEGYYTMEGDGWSLEIEMP